MIKAILHFLWTTAIDWLTAKAPKTVSTSTTSIGVTSDVGAVAGAIASATNLVSKLQDEHNTAIMISAKVARERQDRIDQINEAIKNGDLDALRKLSSS